MDDLNKSIDKNPPSSSLQGKPTYGNSVNKQPPAPKTPPPTQKK